MHIESYNRVIEHARQLQELRAEPGQQPTPIQNVIRSRMLAAFLGIYLRPITPVQWTEILDSLYGMRVPARVGEPWKFLPAHVLLMTACAVAAFRSPVGLFMRKPVNGEELRAICSAQGFLCGRTNLGFMEGTLCLLVEFGRARCTW